MKTIHILSAVFFILLYCGAEDKFSNGSNTNTSAADTVNVLRVMTFNIRYDNPDDGINAWPGRKGMVADVINKYRTDLVGIQEALIGQIHDLEDLLPGYSWFGVGRDDGKAGGEFCAVLYRKDRLEILENDTFWLSQTPATPGSFGWDAACVRIMTFGKFLDKRTREKFWLFNTHFDHMGKIAREKSVDLIRTKIRAIAGEDPFLLAGDFNAADTSMVYKKLTGAEKSGAERDGIVLLDARKTCRTCRGGVEYTFQGFGRNIPGERIDYIFVPSAVQVREYRLIEDWENGRFPSDHYPVLVEVAISL